MQARSDRPDGAAPGQSVELPSFGAGIAFNPQKKTSKEPSQAAARVNQGGLVITEENAGVEVSLSEIQAILLMFCNPKRRCKEVAFWNRWGLKNAGVL